MKEKNSFYTALMLESIAANKSCPKLYQPTQFWDLWTKKLLDEMKSLGFDKFKTSPSCQSLFVSHYGHPFNETPESLISEFVEFSKEKWTFDKQTEYLKFYLSGRMEAFCDYRVLLGSNTGPSCGLDFSTFYEGSIGSPMEQQIYDTGVYSRNSLNYMLQLTFLRQCMGDFVPTTFLEIGGGWGCLGEVLSKTTTSKIKYIDIDISPSNCIAEYYLRETFPEVGVAGFYETNHSDEINISDLPSISVLPSWRIEQLRGEIDVFVNTVSFQEMEPAVVQNYLDIVAKLNPKFLMLRNLREGKRTTPVEKGGSSVQEPVKREFYIKWLTAYGYELASENVVPFGRKTIDGFHSEILVFRPA